MLKKPGSPVLLWIAYASFIVIGMPSAMLNVAWIQIQTVFALPLDALGMLLTVNTLGRLIGSFYSGRISAWLGIGRFIVAGSMMAVVGLLGYVLLPSWPMLVASGFVWGLGTVGINNGVNAFVAAHYSASRLNWLHAWFGVGATIAPLIATFIIFDLGMSWHWSYVVLLVLYIFVTLAFTFTMRYWEIEPKDTSAAPLKRQVSMNDTFKLRVVWFCIALFVIHAGLQVGGGQLNSILLINGRGLDPKLVGTWITIYWGSFTAGRFLTGMVVDRIPNHQFMRANMLLTVCGALIISINFSPLLSFLGLALMGFSLAPISPTLIADTPERVGKLHTPNAIGFQFSAAALGSALLPGLGAALAERLGLEIIPAFLLIIALASVIIHEWLIIRERRAAPTVASS